MIGANNMTERQAKRMRLEMPFDFCDDIIYTITEFVHSASIINFACASKKFYRIALECADNRNSKVYGGPWSIAKAWTTRRARTVLVQYPKLEKKLTSSQTDQAINTYIDDISRIYLPSNNIDGLLIDIDIGASSNFFLAQFGWSLRKQIDTKLIDVRHYVVNEKGSLVHPSDKTKVTSSIGCKIKHAKLHVNASTGGKSILKFIGLLPFLETLYIQVTRYYDGSIQETFDMPVLGQLRALDMDIGAPDSASDDCFRSILYVAENIRKVRFVYDACQLRNSFLEFLSGFRQLTHVSLITRHGSAKIGNLFSDSAIANLINTTQCLESLKITACQLTGDVFNWLVRNPTLKHLHLERIETKIREIPYYSLNYHLENLETLELVGFAYLGFWGSVHWRCPNIRRIRVGSGEKDEKNRIDAFCDYLESDFFEKLEDLDLNVSEEGNSRISRIRPNLDLSRFDGDY